MSKSSDQGKAIAELMLRIGRPEFTWVGKVMETLPKDRVIGIVPPHILGDFMGIPMNLLHVDMPGRLAIFTISKDNLRTVLLKVFPVAADELGPTTLFYVNDAHDVHLLTNDHEAARKSEIKAASLALGMLAGRNKTHKPLVN